MPGRCGVVGGLAVHLDQRAPLVRGRRLAGEHAERLVDTARPAPRRRRPQAVDRPAQPVERALARRRIGADRVVRLVGQHGDGGAARPSSCSSWPMRPEVRGVALEERHLDAVVAGALELCRAAGSAPR